MSHALPTSLPLRICSKRRAAAAGLLAAAVLAGCASPPPPLASPPPPSVAVAEPSTPTAPAPRLGWRTKIKVPDDYTPTLRLRGRGYQVFRCEDTTEGLAWAYQLPEATLADDRGNPVGRHGANFTFEHDDGSRLAGKVLAWDEARDPGDLRWLLLTTQSYGRGAFEGVAYVQRVNTLGGMPPSNCTASDRGQVLRVEFAADFVFYRATAGAR